MKHLEALSVLPRYFEGELDRDTTRAFHEHLKSCTDCREQIRTMRQFKERQQGAPVERASQSGRRQSRLMRPPVRGPRQISSFNSHDLARSRANQRRLVFQVLLAAAAFFVAVRMGVFKALFP